MKGFDYLLVTIFSAIGSIFLIICLWILLNLPRKKLKGTLVLIGGILLGILWLGSSLHFSYKGLITTDRGYIKNEIKQIRGINFLTKETKKIYIGYMEDGDGVYYCCYEEDGDGWKFKKYSIWDTNLVREKGRDFELEKVTNVRDLGILEKLFHIEKEYFLYNKIYLPDNAEIIDIQTTSLED